MNRLIVVDFKLIRSSVVRRSHSVCLRVFWVQTKAIPVDPRLYGRVRVRLVHCFFNFHLAIRPRLFYGCPYALCTAPRQRVDWDVTVTSNPRLRATRLDSNASIGRRTGQERRNDCVCVEVSTILRQGIDKILNDTDLSSSSTHSC